MTAPDSVEDLPPVLPPILPEMMVVSLPDSTMQTCAAGPGDCTAVMLGTNGALVMVFKGHGVALQFGSLADIARLRGVLDIVHTAHAQVLAFERGPAHAPKVVGHA